jgi:hypothetical protein
MLGFGKLRDVGPGILERDEFAAAGQGDRLVECPLPAAIRHGFNFHAADHTARALRR